MTKSNDTCSYEARDCGIRDSESFVFYLSSELLKFHVVKKEDAFKDYHESFFLNNVRIRNLRDQCL